MTSSALTRAMPVDGHSIMRGPAAGRPGEYRGVPGGGPGGGRKGSAHSVTDLESARPAHPLAGVMVGRCWNH